LSSALGAAQLAPNSQPDQPTDGVFLGDGTAVPAVLDDAVPRPVAPVIVASDAGDHVVAAASGDPYFLGFAGGSYYPPANERLDPLLLASLTANASDGRSAPETY